MRSITRGLLALLAVVQLLSVPPLAAAGDRVGNGAPRTTAEKTYALARERLAIETARCIETGVFADDSKEEAVARQVLTNLRGELKHTDQLVFMSESEEPQHFVRGGESQIALTAPEIGAHVYLNRDMINGDNANVDLPEQLGRATEVLFRELGRHDESLDRQVVERVSLKVGAEVANRRR